MAKLNLNPVSWWKANKGKTFKKGMVIYVCVLVLAFVVSQVVLWTFLSSYQQSLPETAANAFLNGATEEYWKETLKESIYGSSFSSVDADVDSAYNMLFKDKTLKIRRSVSESKDDVQVFKISNGETELCTLPLSKKSGGSYGMVRWASGKAELTAKALEQINPSVSVYLPKDGSFTVNGASATLDAEATESPFATPFEEANKSGFVKYSLRVPCGDISVDASYNGQPLALTTPEDGVYCFDLPGQRINKQITVPEGSEVYVNNVRLTTDYISEKGVAYPFINPVELGLENAPKSTVYTVNGLYNQPVLRVVYNGEELSCGSTEGQALQYSFNTSGTDYTLQVPANAVVTVNGTDISGKAEFITAELAQYSEVGAYSAELVNPVGARQYTLKGLLFIPTIKVTDADGKEYPYTKLTATSFSYTVTPTESAVTEYGSHGETFTVAMMEYLLHGRPTIDKNLARLIGLTRQDSPAHVSLKDSYRGVYWRSQHTITYNDLYIDNFVHLADNAFMCDAHYDVTGHRVSSSRTYETKGFYRLLYIKSGDKWEIIEFTLMDEEA